MTPLRTMLIILTFCVACVGPFLDGTADPHTWRILPTVIAPALMLMLVFALPLDMTMTLVFMSDTTPDKRRKLKRALQIEAAVTVFMVALWTPFYLRFFAL